MTDDMMMGNETFYCELCPGGGVGLPDAVLVVPTQEDRTCGEYEIGNLAGLINATTCPLIQQFSTRGCCELPEGEPTVEPVSSAFGYGAHLAMIGTVGMLASVFFL